WARTRSSEIRPTSRGKCPSSTFWRSAARSGWDGNATLSTRKSASATSRLALSTSARAENQTTPKCSVGEAALSTEMAARAERRVPSHLSICGWATVSVWPPSVDSLGQGAFIAPGRAPAGATAAGEAGRVAGAAGAVGVPAALDAGALDAGIEGACPQAAGRDSSTPRKSRVAIAVHRVVRVILRVIAVLSRSESAPLTRLPANLGAAHQVYDVDVHSTAQGRAAAIKVAPDRRHSCPPRNRPHADADPVTGYT